MIRTGLSLLLLLLLWSGPAQAKLYLHKRVDGQVALKHSDQTASWDYAQGQYSVIKQDESICKTRGENQWTGTVDVTDERRLFYWFFESRNDPKNDPVVIWTNDGPGGSSMMGLFNELGPCILATESNYTYVNGWNWNNNASVLFLDQPADTGSSSVANGAALPAFDLDGAADFQFFLNMFFNEIFPQYSKNTIHIAGESYGGHMVPVYVNHILESRKYNSRDAFTGNISSIILVNALINFPAYMLASYPLLCNPEKPEFNSTICGDMALYYPECMKMEASCSLTYDGEVCQRSSSFCVETVGKYYFEEIAQGRRSNYNIHKPCVTDPVCSDPNEGNFTYYLNTPSIKSKLGFPEDFIFKSINWDLTALYFESNSPWLPTTSHVTNILHSKDNIGVLVINGNDDFIINTPGQIWAYERLWWDGLASYNVARWKDFYVPSDKETRAGFFKQTPDAHLVFVGVDGAGHTVPGDKKEASFAAYSEWISGWRNGL